MTSLDSILKSRDITLLTKVHLVKAMVFPVDMYGCESWTIKKAECQRIDVFELWCWRRLLRVPWDFKEIQPVHPKGDQSWVFIGRSNVEGETPVLWPPDAKSWLNLKRPWCWEGWGAGGEGDDRGWDGWMASLTQWTWVWVNSGSWWWTGRPGMLQLMGSQRVEHDWATELKIPYRDWTPCLYHSILEIPLGDCRFSPLPQEWLWIKLTVLSTLAVLTSYGPHVRKYNFWEVTNQLRH